MLNDIIGQQPAKNKINFSLSAFRLGGFMPHYLFVSAKGSGKTRFAKEVAKEIYAIDNSYKAHLINCATIKNVNSFYEQIYESKIKDQKAIIIADESHNLPDIIQNLLLTTIEVDDQVERIIPTDSGDMKINMRDHIFIFLSSEPDRIFPPLKDRMDIISLNSYKPAELGEILVKQCKEIKFHDGTVAAICDSLRGNPRDAIKASQGIKKYCLINRTTKFSEKDWLEYCKMNDVKPFGLNAGEIQILKILAQNGACSLNDLRGATSISRTAIMNDLEPYLLSKHFIKIDGKRHVTPKGITAWKIIEKSGF